MPQKKTYLAADLGAGSGRVIAGHYDGARLELEELVRFGNEPVRLAGGLHWNIVSLHRDISLGMQQGVAHWRGSVASAGIDTWGVDYGLIDADGTLLGIPYAYRDTRSAGMMDKVRQTADDASLYAATGIQRVFFNTLYQLVAARERSPRSLLGASQLLFIPDLLNYWLTGKAVAERTIASTSQLYNPVTRDWAWPLMERLGIPPGIFGELVDPGTPLGEAAIGGMRLPIVSVGSHDTASAVAAIPARSPNAAYLSCGSWSLLGVELPQPILSDAARAANFTNETGVGGKIRFLRNITGLWLMQECRAAWEKLSGAQIQFAELTEEAIEARPFSAFIDPDSPDLAAPGEMPSRIQAAVSRNGQDIALGRGEITRTIIESLALKCAVVMEQLESLLGRPISELNIVGGGCRDRLLNQFTANALQRPVIAGPAEATATGNILVQMIASGELANLAQGRELVRHSFSTTVYEPTERARWSDALQSYKQFLTRQAP